MSRRSGLTTKTNPRYPVFVFPPSLDFYINDVTSHRQGLTVYNPYDFSQEYKVWCTDPTLYSVSNPKGILKPKCYAEIAVRLTDVSSRNEGRSIKFRVTFTDRERHSSVLGVRDIRAVIQKNKPADAITEDRFQETHPVTAHTSREAVQFDTNTSTATDSSGPSWVILLLALIFTLALILPLEGEASTIFPVFLRISPQQKLIASFLLGMVTMVIFNTARVT